LGQGYGNNSPAGQASGGQYAMYWGGENTMRVW